MTSIKVQGESLEGNQEGTIQALEELETWVHHDIKNSMLNHINKDRLECKTLIKATRKIIKMTDHIIKRVRVGNINKIIEVWIGDQILIRK